ncbi:HAD family hydrolase [Roseobacter ponti]|nr:HAD family hydrolase [Roseobacter ponti]
MTGVRGVLFDKDGTLFDFARTWEAWAVSFLTRLAPDRDHRIRLGTAIGFDVTTEEFSPGSVVVAGTPGEVAAVLAQHLPQFSAEALVDVINAEAEAAPQAEAVPLVPLLEQLRAAGLMLGVATNDAERPARAHLDQAGVTQFFDFIAGFDSGHGAKPGPGQLHAFAAATGLAPDQIVMVGDSTHDLHAGRAAGMRCVGVLTGLAPAEVLAPHADVIMDNIGGLPAWLAMQS